MPKKRGGFTLIELLVVIAIIAPFAKQTHELSAAVPEAERLSG
jgi:prepilin-type N-terminal cleavage/methylation domain-containing protein